MLDLSGVLRAGQSQRPVDEAVGERDPVDGGVGDAVGVEIARRTAEFVVSKIIASTGIMFRMLTLRR